LISSYVGFSQIDSISIETPKNEKRQIVNFNGYVKDLVSIGIPSLKSVWNFDNQFHNRLNLKLYPTTWLTFQIEARNRIYFGNSVQNNPQFGEQVNQSLEFLHLGGIVTQQKSFLIHSIIDRANFKIEKHKWIAIVGKQRINWSNSYVWNPNDLFNAYSFFDFDYEERRGTDAALLKYNISSLSSIQFASNIDSTFNKITMAANYKFNLKEYDFQVLAGKYNTDIAIGVGWAGQIKGAGFKGEITYFHSYNDDATTPTLIGNLSLDYTLPSTLNFRLEIIGNSNPLKKVALQFLTQPVTAKELINNYVSAFGSIGYDITPLLKANIASILNIDDKSMFINPTVDVSLNQNTNLLIATQIFTGTGGSLYEHMGSYLFSRLKWSF
jgi:hypothetical protein